jgi:hypothetical protein
VERLATVESLFLHARMLKAGEVKSSRASKKLYGGLGRPEPQDEVHRIFLSLQPIIIERVFHSQSHLKLALYKACGLLKATARLICHYPNSPKISSGTMKLTGNDSEALPYCHHMLEFFYIRFP